MGRTFDLEFAEQLGFYRSAPYRPVARIAAASGHTFLCFTRSARPMAVKFSGYGRDQAVPIRIRDAVELVATLDSPYLVPHLEAGVEGERLWIAAEYRPGPSVQEAVDRYGPLSREALRHLAQGLTDAFTALHEAGLGGRGLTARDVVLGRDGPVIVDLGFTRVEGLVAPEDTEAWSWRTAEDVRAIGELLYFAATGRAASSGCDDILSPAVGECPVELREVIAASRRTKSAQRPSLAEFSRAAAQTSISSALFSAQWLEEPWQSPDVLREISMRADELADLRARNLGHAIIAAAAHPIRRGREPKVRWEEPGDRDGHPTMAPRRWRWRVFR
jgi:hypothetical protein